MELVGFDDRPYALERESERDDEGMVLERGARRIDAGRQ